MNDKEEKPKYENAAKTFPSVSAVLERVINGEAGVAQSYYNDKPDVAVSIARDLLAKLDTVAKAQEVSVNPKATEVEKAEVTKLLKENKIGALTNNAISITFQRLVTPKHGLDDIANDKDAQSRVGEFVSFGPLVNNALFDFHLSGLDFGTAQDIRKERGLPLIELPDLSTMKDEKNVEKEPKLITPAAGAPFINGKPTNPLDLQMPATGVDTGHSP